MQSIHKLTAGNGYTYLTQQVAACDSTEVSDGQLAEYYSAKGESPGRWVGAGLTGIEGISAGDQVSEEQMKALFGVGRHPDADAMYDRFVADGMEPAQALEATQLGSLFAVNGNEPSEFLKLTSRAYGQWNVAHNQPRTAPIPQEERATIRDRIGRETFMSAYGRAPLDERELAGHIVSQSRPSTQTVAGYDLTFSPVKSISVLWALAPREVAEQVEAAHDAAVAETIGWIEQDVLHTRRGKGGVRTVDVRGAVATAFTHRDSRAGDPDLHTHVAIANKVQDPVDGSWLSIDGKTLFKATVASSERYNTALESQLSTRLGVRFAATAGKGNGTRVVREVVGIDGGLAQHFSARRAMITTKLESLTADFHTAHHRPPTTKEMLALAQQANLATREDKHEPRSLAEQRQTWRASAGQFLGGGDQVEAMLAGVSEQATARTTRLTEGQVSDVAGQVLYAVQSRRARFQPPHVIAEAQRQIRSLDLDADAVQATVEQVVQRVLTEHTPAQSAGAPGAGPEMDLASRPVAVRIDAVDPVVDPALLRRSDGASVYETPLARLFTTTDILAAEQALITAASTTGARAASSNAVDIALLTSVANGAILNPAQVQMVTEMATSGRVVQLALAPAGSGKTTSMRALAAAWTEDGGTVVGLAPSAVAAQELSDAIEGDTDTLTKLTYDLTHGAASGWQARIGANTMVIIDEAGMAGTIELTQAVQFITARGGCVRLVGDDQQLASVAAGGVLRDIAAEVGAVTLSELHRFMVPGEGEATLALRAGDTEALGFYLDHGRAHPDGTLDPHRVRVGAPGELPQMVFDAWRADLHQGRDALMLASTNETVDDLNTRARADKIAAGDVSPDRGVTLASGLQASAGDRIITRRNNRTLRLSPTDHVKNGDRWIVRETLADGSMSVTHSGTGRVLRLPADYVATDVDLGYACTVHGAQGQTVDSSYVLLTGQETRQQLYVALSRGRHANVMFVPSGGDGDEHGMLHPEQVTPPTAVDLLEQVIARDGAQVSARSEKRTENAPETLIARAAERYADTLNVAAAATIGPEAMADLAARAEQAVPGVTAAAAWDTLAAHLALLQLDGADPITALAAAAAAELDTGLDMAAVLDWRLDPTGAHSGGVGPLPWLPAVPRELAKETNPFASALTARHAQVTALAARIHAQAAARAPGEMPAWGTALDTDRALLADVATWRAVHRVPDVDATLTGPPRAGVAAQRHQRALDARVGHVAGPAHHGNTVLREFVLTVQPRLATDPWWPVLAARLDLAEQAGLPVQARITAAAARGPLPDQHPAAALWSRLAVHLTPAAGVAATAGSGATRLRPPWTDTLVGLLPAGVGARVLADPQWPVLVAAIHHATTTTDAPPEEVITTAVGLIGAGNLPTIERHDPAAIALGELTTVLAWRVSDLSSPPPVEGQLVADADVLDVDVQDYLTATAHERHHGPEPVRFYLRNLPDASTDPVDVDPHNGDAIAPADLHDTITVAAVRVQELVDAAGHWFEGNYPASPAQEHLTARFGTDLSDTAYRVGYAPPGWNNLATHLRATHDATPEELIGAGLAKWSSRDTLIDIFRDRLTLGIHDPSGHLVGFTGRDLSGSGGAPKYLNTPTTDTFHKGHLLFGLHKATTGQAPSESVIPVESPRLVRVEGALDAIAITLAGNGAVHGVAPLGTALTDTQADLLASHAHHGTAWLATDNDAAGHTAERTDFTALTARGLTVRSLPLNGVKDPAQLYQENPARMATMLALADQAPLSTERLTDVCIANAADLPGKDTLSVTARVYAARALAQMIAATDPTEWDQQIQYAATHLAAAVDEPVETPARETAHWAATITIAVHEQAATWAPPTDQDRPAEPQQARTRPPTTGDQAVMDRIAKNDLAIAAALARLEGNAPPQTPAEREAAFQAAVARVEETSTPQTPAEREAAFQEALARVKKTSHGQETGPSHDDPEPHHTPTIRPR